MYYYDEQAGLLMEQGIYHISRRKVEGLGRILLRHYGVLCIEIFENNDVIVVSNDQGKGIELQDFNYWLYGVQDWKIEGECPANELPNAITRLELALGNNDSYSLFRNNCEHFATWIVQGDHRSTQIDKAKRWGKRGLKIGVRLAPLITRLL
jgi:hypothetical protein